MKRAEAPREAVEVGADCAENLGFNVEQRGGGGGGGFWAGHPPSQSKGSDWSAEMQKDRRALVSSEMCLVRTCLLSIKFSPVPLCVHLGSTKSTRAPFLPEAAPKPTAESVCLCFT